MEHVTRVLVVDDDPGIAYALVNMLKQLGYEAKGITSPMQVRPEIESFQPEVLLLDLYMAELDGWEVARQVRQSHGHDQLKIIAVSVSNSSTDHLKSRQAGIDAHVGKPVETAELQAILEQFGPPTEGTLEGSLRPRPRS